MLRFPVLLVTATLLVACGQGGEDPAVPETSRVPPPPPDESVQLTGKQAYDQVGAHCHDEGVDGAPRTGDRDAWIDEGLEEYDGSLRRKLILGVYVVPAVLMVVVIYLTNYG